MFPKFLYVNLNFYCNEWLSSFPHLFKYLFTTIWICAHLSYSMVYNPFLSWFILFFKLSPDLVTGSSFMLAPHFFFFFKHFITFWYHMMFQTHVNFFSSLVISPRSSGSFYFRLASRNQEPMSNVLTAMVNKEIYTCTHKHTSVSFSIFIFIYICIIMYTD